MKVLASIILLIGVLALMSLLFALPVMWLWNWLMPEIFGLIEITFWQAVGLCLLSSALFNRSVSDSSD